MFRFASVSWFFLVCCLFSFSVYAQETAGDGEEEVIVLPPAEVTAERDTPEIVTREEMDRAGARDLWESVRDVPGVILSDGGRRGESNFTVRGFGADSVPIYVDGVPIANPYRGEGDSARILIGDLESIEIKKGYGTELLGANAIGGVVLMRIAKPKKPLELQVKTAFDFDRVLNYGAFNTVLSAGTRQHFFYGTGVFQYRGVDHFRLSGDFTPFPGNPQQEGNRLWSDSKDMKITLLAGLTPTADLDIWATYIYQNADKGVSPPDTGASYSIWEWPVWRRHSVSLNSTYTLGRLSLGGLAHFDKYDNRLDEYYTLRAFEQGIHAPHSDYDEYTVGGRVTGDFDVNDFHSLAAAFTWKLEDHRGLRGTIVNETDLTEVIHVSELTLSGGVEYTGKLRQIPLTLKAGFGFDTLTPLEYWNSENEFNSLINAGYYIVKTRNMLLYTWQTGLFYQLTENHETRLTYARKNHFPTMAQRYSTRFGRTLPNSSLGPEAAHHFELGYRGSFSGLLYLNAAAYYSVILGKMATVEIPNPENPSALVEYTRNLDSTSFWGFELVPEFTINDYLALGTALSFNFYTINHSQAEAEYISYCPPFTVNGYLVIHPKIKAISIIPRFEYTAPRFADTQGTAELPGYALLHLKVRAGIGPHVSLSLGVENVFDTLYELRRYSPQSGRSFSIGLEARY